jgi:hypothetical protein
LMSLSQCWKGLECCIQGYHLEFQDAAAHSCLAGWRDLHDFPFRWSIKVWHLFFGIVRFRFYLLLM